MINTKFEAYKIQREINRSGYKITFQRNLKNEFNEDEDRPITIGSIKGLYHEDNSHVSMTMGETTLYRTKKIPMFLCLFSDVDSLKLLPGDFVFINNKKFIFTKSVNIQEWNIICDLSFEEVDNGGK